MIKGFLKKMFAAPKASREPEVIEATEVLNKDGLVHGRDTADLKALNNVQNVDKEIYEPLRRLKEDIAEAEHRLVRVYKDGEWIIKHEVHTPKETSDVVLDSANQMHSTIKGAIQDIIKDGKTPIIAVNNLKHYIPSIVDRFTEPLMTVSVVALEDMPHDMSIAVGPTPGNKIHLGKSDASHSLVQLRAAVPAAPQGQPSGLGRSSRA